MTRIPRPPRRGRHRAPSPRRMPAFAVHARGRRAAAAVLGRRRRLTRGVVDAGTATAEYAVATLAACGFAGLLLVIMRSGEVRGMLTGIIQRALAVG